MRATYSRRALLQGGYVASELHLAADYLVPEV